MALSCTNKLKKKNDFSGGNRYCQNPHSAAKSSNVTDSAVGQGLICGTNTNGSTDTPPVLVHNPICIT